MRLMTHYDFFLFVSFLFLVFNLFVFEKTLSVQCSYANGSFCFPSDRISEMKFTICLNELYVLDLNWQTLNVQMGKRNDHTKFIEIPNAIV